MLDKDLIKICKFLIFFSMLESLYQIPNLNMKCYKLNEKLNLNANKVNLERKIEKSLDFFHL